MIRLHRKERYKRRETKKRGTVLVTLQHCRTRSEVIVALGRKMRAADSAPVTAETSLDGLCDMIFDFFSAELGTSSHVVIEGLENVSRIGRLFAMEVFDVIQFYLSAAIEARSRTEPDFDAAAALSKIQVDIICS